MKIAFIGFGEAARAFRDSLAAKDAALAFSAYDLLLAREGEGGACAAAMRERGVDAAPANKDAVAGADWIFSAVTADQSLEAAKAAAPHMGAGQTFVDINSVSPDRKRESAALVETGGAAYVDMAVMAPVHPRGHATPTLIAGAAAETVSARLADLGFSFDVVGPAPGAATAVKMVRSLFVKGLEAITVETMLAAAASGCFERVMASLRETYPGLGLDELGPYYFQRTLQHGKRRAAEMRESAATLDALGLKGRLAEAIADVHEAMGGLSPTDLGDGELAEEIARLVAMRRA